MAAKYRGNTEMHKIYFLHPPPPNVFTVRRAFIYFLCLIDNIQSISSASAFFICMYVQDILECLKISFSKAAQMITKKELKL